MLKKFSFIVVTGLSGSGKSTALKVFEDLSFFVVDGLPVGMIPKFVALFCEQASKYRGLVLGLDLRQINFPEEWYQSFIKLKDKGVRIHIVFLEARLQELVRRYATTRRPHPLESQNLGLEQALETEKVLLDPLRKRADLVLDTTDYNIHDLRRIIQEKWISLEQDIGVLRVHIISFGFKYGVPIESDLLFDLRFLPNPYSDKNLRFLSGKDRAVADFVLAQDPGHTFSKYFMNFLSYLLPLYLAEGRYRVTLALGCTGGRHRSVAVSELVCKAMKRKGYALTLEHRHLELG